MKKLVLLGTILMLTGVQTAWAEVAIPEVPTSFVPFVIGAGAGLVIWIRTLIKK